MHESDVPKKAARGEEMRDIVRQLRDPGKGLDCRGCFDFVMEHAADEIERWRRRAELAEGELEALSLSHRDLASRLAKMGNEQKADAESGS